MKKFLLLVIIFGSLGYGGYYLYNKKQEAEKEEALVAEIKKGWYVEVLTDFINVRKTHNAYDAKIGEVKKGMVYKVLEYNGEDDAYHWYKIELRDGTIGWISNTRSFTKEQFLKDYNNPEDIAIPKITYDNDTYYVDNIDNINYNHLTLWDDREGYSVTHEVYHEYMECSDDNFSFSCEDKDQYWIKYTITDAVGKSSSKTQKIVFVENPSPNQVKDFYKEYSPN